MRFCKVCKPQSANQVRIADRFARAGVRGIGGMARTMHISDILQVEIGTDGRTKIDNDRIRDRRGAGPFEQGSFVMGDKKQKPAKPGAKTVKK